MRKLPLKQGLIAGSAILALTGTAFATPGVRPQAAHPAQAEQPVRPTNTTTPTRESAQVRTQQAPSERKEAAQGRLDAAKLKACQGREKAITSIMTRIATSGEKQLEVFTKISDRTQAFYESKGKTLASYDALVAEVDAKKTAAEKAVEELKSGSKEFDCEGADPKATAQAFKDDVKAANAALKEYKLAVKNLIVGVKSVQVEESSTGAKSNEAVSGSEKKTQGGQR